MLWLFIHFVVVVVEGGDIAVGASSSCDGGVVCCCWSCCCFKARCFRTRRTVKTTAPHVSAPAPTPTHSHTAQMMFSPCSSSLFLFVGLFGEDFDVEDVEVVVVLVDSDDCVVVPGAVHGFVAKCPTLVHSDPAPQTRQPS